MSQSDYINPPPGSFHLIKKSYYISYYTSTQFCKLYNGHPFAKNQQG